MPVVFLTSASTSPWDRPGDWTDAGHTVNLVGCGGRGGTTVTGTSYRSGSGGGGGVHGLLTRTSGSLPATTDFTIFADSAVGANNSAALTRWGGTSSNTWQAGSGSIGASATAGGGGGTTLSLTGTFAVVYTSSQVNAGGAGGATSAVTGSAAGGGGAGGPSGVGGVGGPCLTASRGGGGGGASNGGGSAPSTSASANGTQGGGTGGAGGTSGVAAGNGGAGTGDGGGGGFFTAAVADVHGGDGGDEDNWSADSIIVGTSDTGSGTGGPGGGGGGGGAASVNTAGCTTSGGNGANYGAGGGGAGGTRSGTSTRTPGTGASGLIVITYTAGGVTHQGAAVLSVGGQLNESPSSSQFEAWWNFVSAADDATGNGNDGTLHGTTLTIDNYNRSARGFNGSSDYIDGTSSPLEP